MSRKMLCFILILGGCAQPDDTSASQVDSPIIGGSSDDQDPGVIALYAQQNMGGALCTASVISPTVLLTAAHCVAPSEVGSGAIFVGLIGSNLNGGKGQELAVKETHYDTAFDINHPENGHDIGVAILQMPTTLAPLPINRTADPTTLIGRTVRLVGYGVNNGAAQTGAGVKRVVNAPVDAVDDSLIKIGDSGHDTCQGDSGGPAFATFDGVKTIVGLTSFGSSGCTGGGYDTRVDHYLAFIDKYVGAGGASSSSAGNSSGNKTATQSENESNDSSATANVVSADVVDGAMDVPGDVDWFELDLSGKGSFALDLSAKRSSLNFRVYKLAPSGELSSLGTGQQASSGADRQFTRNSTAGGTYYIKVLDDGENHTDDGTYELSIELE